ncbi:MAG: response regulator [Planctomycetota bacterium]
MDRVLIVEDESTSRQFLQSIVTSGGYACHASEDADSALAWAQKQCFTVLLTDLVMPGMDGLELFVRLRRQHPLLRGIVCSAYLDYGRMTSLIEAGFDDCLLKPVRREPLVHSINRSYAIRFHWQDRLAQLRGLGLEHE